MIKHHIQWLDDEAFWQRLEKHIEDHNLKKSHKTYKKIIQSLVDKAIASEEENDNAEDINELYRQMEKMKKEIKKLKQAK